MNRIITVQLEITDTDKAKWLWNYHRIQSDLYGFFIQVIQEGPIPEQVEDED